MLNECMEGLSIRPGGKYADVTFGGGGHSNEILKRLDQGKLLAFDKDPDAAANLPDDQRVFFAPSSFRFLKRYARYFDMIPLDGVLADLGISSRQIDNPERGFSTRFRQARLDMNMAKGKKNARELINGYGESELVRVFSEYGEIHNSRRLARAIIEACQVKPLETAGDLIDAIERCTPKEAPAKYHAQVFQALRIEVNQEMDELRAFLMQTGEVLKPGGRLVVISYHSLEDRLVKHYMVKGKFEGEPEKDEYGNPLGLRFRMLTKKPMLPGSEEMSANPRSRSAKLRIAEKL